MVRLPKRGGADKLCRLTLCRWLCAKGKDLQTGTTKMFLLYRTHRGKDVVRRDEDGGELG